MSRATLQRSVTLFRGFRREASDPSYFYSLLADDSVDQVSAFTDISGKIVLDVGGGPGYFSSAFSKAGGEYLGLDPCAETAGMIRGSGTALPIQTGVIDVCFSSNVLEHVDEPEVMLSEMARVTRPGGLVFVTFTPWLSPWGGHETSPWHFLGGHYARRRYQRRNGREPKNAFGTSLFAVSAGRAIRWARRCPDVEVLAVMPRYHPWWAHWVIHLPGLREVLSWNVAFALRRR